ncbi:hypothetical protein ACLB2K_061715 [Fragaria x ananassa]
MPRLMGMKSKKVVQTLPKTLDSTVEWEPIREEGFKVKLKMAGSHDEFSRANGGVPPWRNSITHDTAHRKLAKDGCCGMWTWCRLLGQRKRCRMAVTWSNGNLVRPRQRMMT